jgi:uncharacterized protein
MPSEVYYVKIGPDSSGKEVSEKLDMLLDKSRILDFIKKDDFAGIKIHFGEEANTGHIKAQWLKGFVRRIKSITNNAFFTDTGVLYKQSKRTNAVDHLKLACDHGFGCENILLPTVIADGLWGRDYVDVQINKKRFSKVKIASGIADCDSLLALTHVTGHIMTGFAGAIKNLGMGCASRRGKFEQHCGVVPNFDSSLCVGCAVCVSDCPAGCISLEGGKARVNENKCIGCGECVVVCKTDAINTKWSETLGNLQEKMVEYAYGAIKSAKGRIGCINFLTNITKDCDCLAKDEARIIHDIGILASTDIVSIDKASADLVNEAKKDDLFKMQHPQIDWTAQLKYAADLGMGRLDYTLKTI